MSVTHYDVVEGRIALSLMLGLLAFALVAHLIVGAPMSAAPALIAFGGLTVITLQNGMLYMGRLVGDGETEAEGAEAA